MNIEPKLKRVAAGQRLTTNLFNSIIRRIEYAGDMIQRHSPIAGDDIFVEQQKDGRTISYLQQVGGGIRPRPPSFFPYPYPYPSDLTPPENPEFYGCGDAFGFSKAENVGYDKCPTTGPPCPGTNPSCSGLGFEGYIVSGAVWPNSCLQTLSPKCSFAAGFDDYGSIENAECPLPSGCNSCSFSGITSARIGSYDSDNFFIYIRYVAKNGPMGGPYGYSISGALFMSNVANTL